jgi:hypothetical protein
MPGLERSNFVLQNMILPFLSLNNLCLFFAAYYVYMSASKILYTITSSGDYYYSGYKIEIAFFELKLGTVLSKVRVENLMRHLYNMYSI